VFVRSGFRDLAAYQRAAALAIDLQRAVAEWPSFERWTVGQQLVRAADSVAANIAESSGRWHPLDKRRLLLIARGSLYETEHWMAQAEELGLLDPGWTDRLDPIARPLNGLIDKWTPG
jgi:four helix bundle protein